MLELGGSSARSLHAGDGLHVKRANIQHERVANGRDVNHIGRLVAHDRACAHGEHGVRAAFHGHVIRDAVDERGRRAHIIGKRLDGFGDFRCGLICGIVRSHAMLPSLALPISGSVGRSQEAPSQPASASSPLCRSELYGARGERSTKIRKRQRRV